MRGVTAPIRVGSRFELTTIDLNNGVIGTTVFGVKIVCGRRKIWIFRLSPVVKARLDSTGQIMKDIFDCDVVLSGGVGRILAELDEREGNVWSGGDHAIYQFPDSLSVVKLHFVL